MARREIDTIWDRETRNDINENFIELYNEYIGAGLDAKEARQKAEEAIKKANSVQEQFNQVVIEGDSSVEAAQARVDADGNTYNTLKERLDDKETKFSSQLYNVKNMINYELNSKGRKKRGITVFVSDDGRIEEYTIAKPIFESEGVPQSIAVVSDWVGTNGFCSVEQLLELQNDLGWEIMSHSKSHPQPFPNVSDEQAEIEIRDSKLELESMGFEVHNYAYPGGNYGKRERELTKKYYRSARCSNAGFHSGVNYPPINTHELKTIWLDPTTPPLSTYLQSHDKQTAIQMTIADVKRSIDEARDNDGLVIVSTHFRAISDVDYQNMYSEVIQYSKANTEVMTLNDALNEMGNIIEIGDYSEQGLREHGDNHFVVGVDGLASGTLTVTEPNRFTPKTYFREFPLGVTITPIENSHADGAPSNYAGVLINYRPRQYAEGNGYGWQEYMIHSGVSRGRVIKFRRDVISNAEFGEWYSDAGINLPSFNSFDASTPYSDFPVGITFSRVTTNSPGLIESPKSSSGTLVTYKLDSTQNSPAYSYQEYHIRTTNEVYKRKVISANEFGEWHKASEFFIDDSFSPTTLFSDFGEGITYTVITSDNPNLSDMPEGNRGTIVTHKISDAPSYSYQEVHSPVGSAYYKRHPVSQTEWGAWRKVVTETITSGN